MSTRRLQAKMIGFCLGVGLVLTGTLSGAKAADAVSLRLDWTVLAYHMPFYLASQRGYYKDANLDVTIAEGKGTVTTVNLVATGGDTFGFADASGMAKAVGLGAPVKMVMGIIQRSPMAIVVAANSPIRSAQDLKGKSVASCPGSLPGVFLPAYLGAVGIPVSDVKVVSTQCGPAMYQTIPMKQADAMAGYAPISRGILKRLDVPEVRSLAYSDAGILIPAFGILASTETIKSKPDVVRRFLAATVKGWEEAKRDPDAAVAATVAANPLLKGREGSYKEEFLETLEYVETPNTKGKPFGWQSVDDWKAAQEILVKHMDVKPQSNVDVYFTNEFLPK